MIVNDLLKLISVQTVQKVETAIAFCVKTLDSSFLIGWFIYIKYAYEILSLKMDSLVPWSFYSRKDYLSVSLKCKKWVFTDENIMLFVFVLNQKVEICAWRHVTDTGSHQSKSITEFLCKIKICACSPKLLHSCRSFLTGLKQYMYYRWPCTKKLLTNISMYILNTLVYKYRIKTRIDGKHLCLVSVSKFCHGSDRLQK